MKIRRIMSFLSIFTFVLAAGLQAQEAAYLSIDISSQSKGANVEVRPGKVMPEGTAAQLHILREIVTTGASSVSAEVLQDENTEASTLNLGDFEAKITLFVRGDDSYEAVIKMTALKEGAPSKDTKLSISFAADEIAEFQEENINLMSQRFAAIAKELYRDQGAEYGEEFETALTRFAEEYVLGVMDSAPQVINSMLQRDMAIRAQQKKPLREITEESSPQVIEAEEVKGAVPVGVYEMKYDKKYMREYYREETLSIRPEEFDSRIILVPEYLTLTSFEIPDPTDESATAVSLAKVEYFVATVPTPYGSYQTTFILSVNYRMLGKITYQKIMQHEGTINEGVFFPRWRLEFLNPALKAIVDASKGAADRKAREAFVAYFEPFMFDEYYDFSPLLVKAKMAFEDKSTQDKIAQALRRNAEETQRKIREMKERQKKLAEPIS